MMTFLGIAMVVAVLTLFGWRAWVLLAAEAPIYRAAGTVLSGLVPIPVFLIIVAYHYAKRAEVIRPRSSL